LGLQLFTKQGIALEDLQTMPALKIMECGLVVIPQLEALMLALATL
jgi:hypothetical protein